MMNSKTMYEQALELEARQEYAAALKLFEQCTGDDVCDAGEVHFHRAWCLEQGGNSEAASHLYPIAAEQSASPLTRINSFFRAGWLSLQDKDYLKAATFLRLAVECAEVAGLRTDLYHHAAYWYAVCLEAQGRFLDALGWYRLVERNAAALAPEARIREISCLNQIGYFADALIACRMFEMPPPEEFNARRYEELRSIARREALQLETCLGPGVMTPRRTVHATD